MDLAAAVAAVLFAVAGFFLIADNFAYLTPPTPIFLLWGVYFAGFPFTGFVLLTRTPREYSEYPPFSVRLSQVLCFAIAVVLMPFLFVRGMLGDSTGHFGPFSYPMIPVTLIGVSWLVFITLFIIQIHRLLTGRFVRRGFMLYPMQLILLAGIIPVYRILDYRI